jgi:hypothetical protein
MSSAVVSATVGGTVAALAALVALALFEQAGSADFVLTAKVVGLELTGDAGAVDSIFGVISIFLACLAIGAASGALFGVILSKFIGEIGPITALVVGITYGLLGWIVTQFVIIASIAPNAIALTDEHAMCLASVVYGALLGLLSGWSRHPRNSRATLRLGRLWG